MKSVFICTRDIEKFSERPKKPLKNLISGHLVRFSEVMPSDNFSAFPRNIINIRTMIGDSVTIVQVKETRK